MDLANLLSDLLVKTLQFTKEDIQCRNRGQTNAKQAEIQLSHLEELKEDLVHSQALFLLLPKRRLSSDWASFELGAFLEESKPIFLFVGPGIKKQHLPKPLASLPLIELYSNNGRGELVKVLQVLANSLRGGAIKEANQEQEKFLQSFYDKNKMSWKDVLQGIKLCPIGLASLILPFAFIWTVGDNLADHTAKQNINKLIDFCRNRSAKEEFISCGESDLLSTTTNVTPSDLENSATKAFEEGRYEEASSKFSAAISKLKKDKQLPNPSLKIASSNADILSRISKGLPTRVFAIAMTISMKTNPFMARGLLTGVAKRQEQFNQNPFGARLFVIMADDQNHPKNAAEQAAEFAQYPFILALIGPYSSESTVRQLEALKKKGLLLVSATSTATRSAYEDRLKQDMKNFTSEDFTWFQRTASTTRLGAKQLVKQIQASKPKNNKILLFYQGGESDLFVRSFIEDLKTNLKDADIDFVKNVTKNQNSNDTGINLGRIKNNSEILEVINSFKRDQKASPSLGEIIIVIVPNAFRKGEAPSEGTGQTDFILDSNKDGELLIFAANTLYRRELLDKVCINPKIGKRLIINVPWFPSEELLKLEPDLRGQQEQQCFKENRSFIGWHYGPAFDATSVIVESIEQLIDVGKNVTRKSLHEKVEDLRKNKLSFTGIGGIKFQLAISEHSPGRLEEESHLVTPDCNLNGICFWRRLKTMTQ
ncbi:MAG: ABC transporter substrate-binding protein [Cyanobacteriota bacterium]